MARRALLVGINQYPGAALRGCLTDVDRMAARLVEKDGWSCKDIRLLTDKRATADAIRQRLDWLVSFATPGDQLFFHFSGHGARMATRSGLGNVDRLHNCICPVDFDWSPERALLDTDFADIFADVPKGVSLTWVSDSCHSGNLARNIHLVRYNAEDYGTYRRPRSFPMPYDIAWRNATALDCGISAIDFERTAKHLNGVLLAGCKSEQTSADAFIDGQYCGAFTTALLGQLSEPSAVTQPVSEIVTEANEWLDSLGYEQDPQAKGDPGRISKPWLSS